VAKGIAQKLERPVNIVVDPERLRPEKSEVFRLISDNKQAREVLGWAPQVSLEEGLTLTIDWIREHLERYQPGKYEL
jgi:dTDP-glucose 4,6-dehydratase